MKNSNINFWIDDWYKTPPNEISIDLDIAYEFLLLAKKELLELEHPLALHSGSVARDLIRINKKFEIKDLEDRIPIQEKPVFFYKLMQAKISVESNQQILESLPTLEENNKLYALKRLFAQEKIEKVITKVNYNEFSKTAKNEFFALICSHSNNYELILKIFNEVKNELEITQSPSIVRKIASDLSNNKIQLDFALRTLEEVNFHSNQYLKILASNLGHSGNIESMSYVINLIDDKEIIKNTLWFLTKQNVFFSFDKKNQKLFLNELRKVKHNQTAKIHLDLLEKILTPSMKIDTDLIDFVKKHHKKQIDDLIHYYLVQNNKLKESILFIDLIQGKNRFEQYKKSFIKLLELEEFHYVIEKSKEIKDNDLKIEIVLQLADKNLIDMAKKASKELIKSAQIRNLSNYGLIKFYARTRQIDEIHKLVKKDKLPISKIMTYNSIARYFMGLKYKNAE